ncbi:PA216 protein, partial [Cinclus mexicanus]|nr:PA216 protein [Cinclus mexicanus]
IIEIDRPYYQHWALYMGNGYVIHVTDKGDASILGSMASVQTPWPKVKKELLMKVAGCDKWRVNNTYDRNWSPRPVKEIIQVAEKYIDMEVHYAVNSINCEHFFIRLRYGLAVYVLVSDT